MTRKSNMPDASIRIEAIDILPCIGIQCNLNELDGNVEKYDAHNYKILTTRARYISTYKRKAILPPNTSVSEVSGPRFSRDVRKRGAGKTDKITAKDKISIPRPYSSVRNAEEELGEETVPQKKGHATTTIHPLSDIIATANIAGIRANRLGGSERNSSR